MFRQWTLLTPSPIAKPSSNQKVQLVLTTLVTAYMPCMSCPLVSAECLIFETRNLCHLDTEDFLAAIQYFMREKNFPEYPLILLSCLWYRHKNKFQAKFVQKILVCGTCESPCTGIVSRQPFKKTSKFAKTHFHCGWSIAERQKFCVLASRLLETDRHLGFLSIFFCHKGDLQNLKWCNFDRGEEQ